MIVIIVNKDSTKYAALVDDAAYEKNGEALQALAEDIEKASHGLERLACIHNATCFNKVADVVRDIRQRFQLKQGPPIKAWLVEFEASVDVLNSDDVGTIQDFWSETLNADATIMDWAYCNDLAQREGGLWASRLRVITSANPVDHFLKELARYKYVVDHEVMSVLRVNVSDLYEEGDFEASWTVA